MAVTQTLPLERPGASAPGVSPAALPASDRLYRPQLDALRFFAFFSVFLFHATRILKLTGPLGALTDAGAYGMCVFFILSSYLITSLLIRERAKFGKIHVKDFYIRRALRIWPLYFTFLGFNYVVGHFAHSLYLETPRLLAFLFMIGNWYVASAGFGTSPIYPLWSISLEEQFYLVWPALVSRSRTFLLWASWALVPISLGSVYLLVVRGATPDQIWVNSFAQFLFFACGSLLALAESRNAFGTHGARGLLLLAAGFGSWWAIETAFHIKAKTALVGAMPFTVGYVAIALSCLAILYGALNIPARFVPSWLTYLGKISYGLYVFHTFWPSHLGVFQSWPLRTAASLTATIICAALSYRFLERPFLALKHRFEFVHSRPE
jgi:peptidoglycan/LPS O-acetylase OafA/YrhL